MSGGYYPPNPNQMPNKQNYPNNHQQYNFQYGQTPNYNMNSGWDDAPTQQQQFFMPSPTTNTQNNVSNPFNTLQNYGGMNYGGQQFAQKPYTQPQYGQPNYNQQQYGQAQYGQPSFGQQQHGLQQAPTNTYGVQPKMTQSSYYPEQVQYKNTNVSTLSEQNQYPNLQQYKPPKKQVGSEQIDFIGWAQQKSPQDKQKDNLGKTKFVVQLGNTSVKENTIARSQVASQSTSSMNKKVGQALTQGFFNPNTGSQNNPYLLWEQATNNLHSKGEQFTGLNNNQFQQQNRNQSVWNNIDFRAISYHIPSIFQQNVRIQEFPSPFIRYKIIPYLEQKKSLDVTSVNQKWRGYKKNNFIIWQYHGGPNQIFYIKQTAPNSKMYFIINLARGFAIRAPEKQQGKQAPLLACPLDSYTINNRDFYWKLRQVGDSYLIESAVNPSYVFDLYNQRTSDGTSVILWQNKDPSKQKNQRWRIVPA